MVNTRFVTGARLDYQTVKSINRPFGLVRLETLEMAQKIATVFGGTGFLARYIVPQLTKAGYRVRIASRHPSKTRHLMTQGDVGQIQAVYAPIQDAQAVAAAVEGADVVINLVGLLFESGKGQTFEATMVDGAGNVASAASKAGASAVVHVSAIGADHGSSSEYARCKAQGEDAVLRGFPKATILRPSIVVGPEDGFFNRFGGMPVVPLIGGGKTKFQPICVGDVAEAVMSAINSGSAKGKIYEIAGPNVYSFKELMDLMQSVTLSKAPQVHVPWGVAELIGLVGSLAPVPPLTRDQVKLLRSDNVADGSKPGAEDLGVDTAPIESILPTYLVRFRNGGQYAEA